MAMINNSPADLFSALNPAQAGEASRSRNVSDMGSDDFLTLMIAQMKNQDPTQPMDQMAFMSQLAQFGTLSGVPTRVDTGGLRDSQRVHWSPRWGHS